MIILDIDDTISDSAWREYYAVNKMWDRYNELSINDKPIIGALGLFKYYKQMARIIFLTSRPIKWETLTQNWLYKKGFHGYDRLIMRPHGDFRKACAIKSEQLLQLNVNDILLFLDNDSETINAVKKIGINAIRVRVRGNTE